jgi:hypothetical protein
MFNLAELGAILTAGRQPGQELSPTARAAIAGAVAAGASQTAVADAFSISRRAVQLSLQRLESSTPLSLSPELAGQRFLGVVRNGTSCSWLSGTLSTRSRCLQVF